MRLYHYKSKHEVEEQQNDKCIRKISTVWEIQCAGFGLGILSLYRMKNGTLKLMRPSGTIGSTFEQYYVSKRFYTFRDVTKKDEGYFICYMDTTEYGRWASKQFYLPVNSKYIKYKNLWLMMFQMIMFSEIFSNIF